MTLLSRIITQTIAMLDIEALYGILGSTLNLAK